jgi:uncharacterized protein YacL (UPF0231 family)
MTVEIRFYRDQEGRPQLQAKEQHAVLTDFLPSDLQDEATCAEVLQAVATAGEQEINGNSYTLVLTPETITIESMFDDEAEPYQLSREQFANILSSWKDFLDNQGLLSLVPKF